MDDSLAQPGAELPKLSLGDQRADPDEEEQASDEEDGGPDWTKLIPGPNHNVVIPKRGEKQFEPASGGETNLQQAILQRARDAMLTTLKAERTISNKSISYAVWHPQLARAEVTMSRGVLLNSMGHTVPRPYLHEDGSVKKQKRLELLPEEVIYLVERGSMLCWKETSGDLSQIENKPEGMAGSPMTVQQVYSEMIGKEDLSLERYEVYTYLKRLGYVVTRANPPSPFYPEAQPFPMLSKPKPQPACFLQRILNLFPVWLSNLFKVFDWWKPMRISRWMHHDKNYGHIFRSLRFLPVGHEVPLAPPPIPPKTTSYRIFWNIYKPATQFRKTSPPPPDFQIVVINARTTPMPTLRELTDLFDVSPELPPPKPRQRHNPQQQKELARKPPAPLSPSPPPSFFLSIMRWMWPSTLQTEPLARKMNPFMMLKAGRKMVIIAVVDSGNIGFFRFSQGVFTEWPMQ